MSQKILSYYPLPLLFLLVLQLMLWLGPAAVLWLKRHSAFLVTSYVSLSFLVDGVMIASYCYLWWRWWSYTLWVTLSMLWLYSFLFWCGQNSHNVHLRVVFVEFSLQSHAFVHSSTYLLDSLGLPVASHICNCCIKCLGSLKVLIQKRSASHWDPRFLCKFFGIILYLQFSCQCHRLVSSFTV